MMRRLFFRRATAAVAVAPVMISKVNVMPDQGPHPPPSVYYSGVVGSNIKEAAYDPIKILMNEKRNKYNTSMQAARLIQNKIANRKHLVAHQMDLNIEALRSVSRQHKAIMQESQHDRWTEERMSWKDKLLKQFGLKREDVYDDEPQAASASGY